MISNKRVTNPNGRPKLPEDKKKKHMTISVTKEDHILIKNLARDKGVTVSELLLSYVQNELKS